MKELEDEQPYELCIMDGVTVMPVHRRGAGRDIQAEGLSKPVYRGLHKTGGRIREVESD